MLRIVLATIVCFYIFAVAASTEKPEEISTTTHATEDDRIPDGYIKVNNLPELEEGCGFKFVCKRKLRTPKAPKPCIKYCAKSIHCDNGNKSYAGRGQCVEFNEKMVMQKYNEDLKNAGNTTSPGIMPVHLARVYCRSGFRVDRRGRCRRRF